MSNNIPTFGKFYIDLWIDGKAIRYYDAMFVHYIMTHNDNRYGNYLTHGFIPILENRR